VFGRPSGSGVAVAALVTESRGAGGGALGAGPAACDGPVAGVAAGGPAVGTAVVEVVVVGQVVVVVGLVVVDVVLVDVVLIDVDVVLVLVLVVVVSAAAGNTVLSWAATAARQSTETRRRFAAWELRERFDNLPSGRIGAVPVEDRRPN
jgi:hypothetical protein